MKMSKQDEKFRQEVVELFAKHNKGGFFVFTNSNKKVEGFYTCSATPYKTIDDVKRLVKIIFLNDKEKEV